MNQEQLRIASDCLRAIKDDNGGVREKANGICLAMSNYFMETHETDENNDVIYTAINDLMATWPEGTGSSIYPVPCSDVEGYVAAKEQYLNSPDCWVGDYGDLRLNLLGWLIAKVEDQFN